MSFIIALAFPTAITYAMLSILSANSASWEQKCKG